MFPLHIGWVTVVLSGCGPCITKKVRFLPHKSHFFANRVGPPHAKLS